MNLFPVTNQGLKEKYKEWLQTRESGKALSLSEELVLQFGHKHFNVPANGDDLSPLKLAKKL